MVELLRKDHEKVKTLFRDFESAEESKEKGHIVQQAIAELEVHAAAEEKVFYPAVRKDSPDAASNLDESLEEHHVMRLLIEELKVMSPEDERFDAKFTVMAENVRHHIKEEESELFARARTGDLNLNDLGKEASRRQIVGPLQSQSAETKSHLQAKTSEEQGACREHASKKHTSVPPLPKPQKGDGWVLQRAWAYGRNISPRLTTGRG